MASNVTPIAIPGSSGVVGPTPTLATSDVSYFGFSARETSGTASAVFRLRDGGVITGTIVETVSLAAGESSSDFYGPQGIRVRGGLYYELVSGAVAGSVRVG